MGNNTNLRLCLALLALCAAALLCGAERTLIGRLLHRDSTTTTSTTTEANRRPLFINNHLPNIEPSCTPHYVCSKKLTSLPAPRPCVKYCLKRIECPNNVKIRGKPNECVELDETQVVAEYEAAAAAARPASAGTATTEKIMEVAMIDFPCQPGYLPDSRGRCREIW